MDYGLRSLTGRNSIKDSKEGCTKRKCEELLKCVCKYANEASTIGDEIEVAILPHKKDFSGFGLAKHAKIPFSKITSFQPKL